MTAEMWHTRRLLFLSYWVPPRAGIGSLRSAHLIKHLPRYGWDVTVLTAQFPHTDLRDYVQTAYCDLKGAVKRLAGIGDRSTHEALGVAVPAYGGKLTAMQRLIRAAAAPVTYPDEQVGWLPFAIATARRLLDQAPYDAILSSAPPFTTHIAAALSHGEVPWIADLRDLWAEDDSFEHSKARTVMDDRLERFCLARAAALTVSSVRSNARFQRRYPNKRCYAISSGFDAQEWEDVPFGAERQCTLLYAGTLYSGKRDPTMLFAAVRSILDEGLADETEIRVDFYARVEQWLLALIARFNLHSVVRLHGFIDRRDVLAAQRRANRLIVLSWAGATAEGVVAGKLFEYFGARRPVLAIGGPADSGVEDLLRETGTGVRAQTLDGIKAEVLNALEEHRNGIRRVIPAQAVSAYTGEHCARQFASVLNSVATPPVPEPAYSPESDRERTRA